MKTKIYVSIAVVAAIVLISGATFLATAAPADQSDPLVTRSYLTNFFKPKVVDPDIKAAGDALSTSFNAEVTRLEGLVKVIPTPPSVNLFNTVTLNKNETLNFKEGDEIMVRSNNGTARMTSGGLIDYTNGLALPVNNNLAKNHMYLATENGVITAIESVTLFVRSDRIVTKGAIAEFDFGDELEGPDASTDSTEPDETEESDNFEDSLE